MTIIEQSGNASLIRIGKTADNSVYNYSSPIAVVYQEKTIPLLWGDGTARYEISGANKQTALMTEVRGTYVYLLEQSTPTFTYQVYKHDLDSGIMVAEWDTESRDWGNKGDQWNRAIYGVPQYNKKFQEFRSDFKGLFEIPDHGSGGYVATKQNWATGNESTDNLSISSVAVDLAVLIFAPGPKSDKITGTAGPDVLGAGKGPDVLTGGTDADQFVFTTPDAFGPKGADKITDFKPDEGDQLVLSPAALKGLSNPKLTTVNSPKQLTAAQKSGNALIYFQPKGQLFYDQNGAGKGYGSGGLFAILLGSPALTESSFGLLE